MRKGFKFARRNARGVYIERASRLHCPSLLRAREPMARRDGGSTTRWGTRKGEFTNARAGAGRRAGDSKGSVR